jgi:hypothetical protein
MTTFDKREEGFESQFAHEEDLRFRAQARRNKLLGLWVAGQLGLSADTTVDYARTVVAAGTAGDLDVVRKVMSDFDVKGVAMTEQQIRARMDELMAQAVAQVKAGV